MKKVTNEELEAMDRGNGGRVRQPVNSDDRYCCSMPERLVFTVRSEKIQCTVGALIKISPLPGRTTALRVRVAAHHRKRSRNSPLAGTVNGRSLPKHDKGFAALAFGGSEPILSNAARGTGK